MKVVLEQEKIINILNRLLKQTAKIRKGTDAMYRCPQCKHTKLKLEINLISGKYNCWTCGGTFKGLSLRSLFRKLNAPAEYYKEIGELGILKQRPELETLFDEENTRVILNELPPEFIPMYEPNIKSITYKHATNYLKKRGIGEIDWYRYNIGYCDDGKYKNRILIPSYDDDMRLNFYSCRDFFETSYLKYINSEFDKNVIGFESLINFNEPIVLVEGCFDAMTVKNNCIPLFGKTMSNKLKLKLLISKPPMISVLLDNDAFKDAINICDFLLSNGLSVKLVKMQEKDASTIGYTKTWEYINSTKPLEFDTLFKIKLNL